MSEEEPDQPPSPGAALATGVVIYGAMAAAALVWLDLSDRSDALAERAVGHYGPVAASATGLGVGLAGSWVFGRLVSSKDRFQAITSAARRLFARAGDGVVVPFALVSAVAEELFFRLAVQEVFGLAGSVAAYVLLNSTAGGFQWLVFAFAHALALGLLVQSGFGLLGSATAHAVLNYLCLRRIPDS